MRRIRHHHLLAAVAAVALVLTGCSGDDDGGETEAPTEADTGAATETDAATETGEATETGGETEAEGETAASGEPIRIGILTSFTGPFTPWGVQAAAGMEMAAADLNAEGGVDGRPIELVSADDENNPETGVTEFERMVEQDGIVAAGGVISSDVGLATGATAEELEVPLFLVKAGAAEILTSESRYTYRTCLPAAPMIAGPVGDYVEEVGATRVGAIIADYAWGQSVRASLEDEIGGMDGVELQVEVAPVDETDFTTYLRNLQELDPEIIVASGHPPGAGPITIQSTDLGMDVPVAGPYAPLATIYEAVGDVALGKFSDFMCSDFSSPEYQELAARFAEETEFTFMEADAIAGYAIVNMVAQAVTEVGDDPVAINEYLHATTFDMPGYAFPLSWTEWGELAEATPHFVQMVEQAPPEGVNPGANWYPEILVVPQPLEPYQPE